MNDTPTTPLHEHEQAREMLDRLFDVLDRTGRLNIVRLADEATSHGFAITRRQLTRWKAGTSAPLTVCRVEEFARAVGVDWTYLYPDGGAWIDEPVPYVVEDDAADWFMRPQTAVLGPVQLRPTLRLVRS